MSRVGKRKQFYHDAKRLYALPGMAFFSKLFKGNAYKLNTKSNEIDTVFLLLYCWWEFTYTPWYLNWIGLVNLCKVQECKMLGRNKIAQEQNDILR